jgi:hypothetical protein
MARGHVILLAFADAHGNLWDMARKIVKRIYKLASDILDCVFDEEHGRFVVLDVQNELIAIARVDGARQDLGEVLAETCGCATP